MKLVFIHDMIAEIDIGKLTDALAEGTQVKVSRTNYHPQKEFKRGVPGVYVVGWCWSINYSEDSIKSALSNVRWTKSQCPNTIVIAWQRPEERDRFLEAGADKFIPYSSPEEELIKAIGEYVGMSGN